MNYLVIEIYIQGKSEANQLPSQRPTGSSASPTAVRSPRGFRGKPKMSHPATHVPSGVHLLTAIHGLGSIASGVLAAGSGLSPAFRRGLMQTESGRLMVEFFGTGTWLFLGFISLILALLSYGSWRLRTYAWPLTLVAYSVGTLGSIWKVTLGIEEAAFAAIVNAGIVAYAATPGVRHAYGWKNGEPSRSKTPV